MAAAALAAAVGAWRRARPFPVVAAGRSMAPTIEPGWLLIVTAGEPHPGLVVVVERDGLELVKRVASIADGDVVVTGDDPDASTDSRSFGPVPRSAVRGVVRGVYWPPRAWRLL